VRLIVWCKACGHRVEPDATGLARRHGAEATVPEWRERSSAPRAAAAMSTWWSPGDRAAIALTASPYLNPSRPLSLRVFGCLPDTDAWGCTEAGVRKASREETAGRVRTDAAVGLWGICRRCLI
jgi:hypothetical protein